MRPPDLPNERERLAALDATHLFYSPAEERFERITRLASHILGAPIALVTLIGGTRQFLKSAQGLDALDIPREASFCAFAIAAGDRLVVEDAARDERFADNPFVLGDPHVRAYAGSVIHSPEGQPLGTLCVLDRKPRHFTIDEIARLEDLAAIAEDEIARAPASAQSDYLRALDAPQRLARIDAESRLLGHDAMAELLVAQARRGRYSIVLVRVAQAAGLSARLGEGTAASAMRAVAGTVLRSIGPEDAVGRFDEGTLIVLAPDADRNAATALSSRLREAIAACPVQAGPISVRLTANTAACTAAGGENPSSLVHAALEQLR